LIVSTWKEGMGFLLISGKPLKEPLAWYGSVVMNTREKLKQARDEYRNITFIKAS
jgi:redox-sensitive bicupin YhaK (pirin superfamily)